MASIGRMRLRLTELQELDKEAQKLRAIKELQEGWTDIDRVLYHQGLPFVSEVIQIELISQHYNNSLVGYFSINKTKEFIGRKYYLPSFGKDVEAYFKGCNVC